MLENLINTDYNYIRDVFLRLMSSCYLLGFINIYNQFIPLLGSKGLLPCGNFIKNTKIKDFPSIFYYNYSDKVLKNTSIIGIILSILSLVGLTERNFFIHFLTIFGN